MFYSLRLKFLVSCVSEILWLTCVPVCGHLPSLLFQNQGTPDPVTQQHVAVIPPKKRLFRGRRRRRRSRGQRRTSRPRTKLLSDSEGHDSTKAGTPLADDRTGCLHAAQGCRKAEAAPVPPDAGINTAVVLLLAFALLVILYVRGEHFRSARQPYPIIITDLGPIIPGVLVIINQQLDDEKTCPPAQQSQPRTPALPSSTAPANKGNRVEKTGRNGKPSRPRKKKKNNAGPAVDNNTQDAKVTKGRSFACHFCKFDPSTHRSCAGLTLSNFPAVAQHLTRSHLLGNLYCPQCWERWDSSLPTSESDRDQHIIAQACTAELGPDRLLPREEARLRREVPRGISDEEKWYWVWDKFFPGHPRPASPYTDNAIHDAVGYFRQGPAYEALAWGLDALTAEQRASPNAILDILQSSYTNVARPLRLYHGIQPDTVLPIEPILDTTAVLPSPVVVPLQPQLQQRPDSPELVLDPALEAEQYPVPFETSTSNPDSPTPHINPFFLESTTGVFEPEDMETEQQDVVQGAS